MTFGEQNTEADAHEQLNFAMESGINFIDTAELYSVPGRQETQGSTERYIGTWLNKRSDRDKIVLATKIAGPNAALNYLRDPLNFSRQQINTAIEGSLKRLQTDYIDLYQLHWPERNVNNFGRLGYEHKTDEAWQDNFAEVVASLDQLIRAGKIRWWGLSNETPWGVMRFLQVARSLGLPAPISIQNPYNLLNRSLEVGLAEVAMRENIGLLAYSPLAFGMLSGKYHDGSDLQKSRITLFPKLARYSAEHIHAIATKYIAIAKKYSISPAHLALAYVNSRPFLISTIIGATSMTQLREDILSIDVTLSQEVIQAIESVHRVNSNPAP